MAVLIDFRGAERPDLAGLDKAGTGACFKVDLRQGNDMRIYFDGGWNSEGTARSIVRFGNGKGCRGLILIGRSAECQVCYWGQLSLSRKPVVLEINTQDEIFVLDTGTTNGVYVTKNGREERIVIGQRVLFNPETDQLRIGPFPFKFEEPEEERQPWTACLEIRPTNPEEQEKAVRRRLENRLSLFGTQNPQ